MATITTLPTAAPEKVKQTRRGRLPKELHAFRDLRRAKFDALSPEQLDAERDRLVRQAAFRKAEQETELGGDLLQVLRMLRAMPPIVRKYVHGWLQADVDLNRMSS